MKPGLVLYLYLNLNHLSHGGNKLVIYHHYSMIECVTMHLIYFLFVLNFISQLCYLTSFCFNRKCLSTIRYDVYRPNNVSLILISNNSIHKIYLFRRPLLYLLSKRVPSDIQMCMCMFIITSDIFFSSFS